MPASQLTPRRVLAVALLAACGAAPFAGSAVADENPFPFALAIKPNAQLLPVLHATEAVGSPEDGREYDYVTKGYFKVAGKTVARLPSFSGHADRTREHLRLAVDAQHDPRRRQTSRNPPRDPDPRAPHHPDHEHPRRHGAPYTDGHTGRIPADPTQLIPAAHDMHVTHARHS
jgi:hypothetical protein